MRVAHRGQRIVAALQTRCNVQGSYQPLACKEATAAHSRDLHGNSTGLKAALAALGVMALMNCWLVPGAAEAAVNGRAAPPITQTVNRWAVQGEAQTPAAQLLPFAQFLQGNLSLSACFRAFGKARGFVLVGEPEALLCALHS
jgi:hypothetical protein